jgi:RecA-family ATPase
VSSSAEDAAIEWRRERDRRQPLKPLPPVRGHDEWRDADAPNSDRYGNGNGAEPPPNGAPPFGEPVDAHTGDDRASPALSIFRPVDLEGRRPPARKWIVHGWVPCGVVTGLYGDGGEGKSLIAQQLQTSTAIGKPWLGLPVEPVPSLGVYCEDEFGELFRRQQDINPSYGISFSDLEGVEWLPRYGMDNVLMTFGRTGVGETTAFQRQILEAALDLHARLVIFDTAADGFAGNENDRGQVRQFISRALGSIAIKIDGSVLLLAHPSRSGLKTNNDGQVDGDGGSTGWSNTMRSRLLLSTPAGESGEPKDPNARILQRKKANYAARHDELRLRWSQGVIEPEAAEMPAGMTPFGRLDAKEVFLSLVRQFDQQNRTISENARAGNYAPRAFAGLPREQRCNFKQPDFAKAMERLFRDGKIKSIPYGRKADERHKIVGVAEDLKSEVS